MVDLSLIWNEGYIGALKIENQQELYIKNRSSYFSASVNRFLGCSMHIQDEDMMMNMACKDNYTSWFMRLQKV